MERAKASKRLPVVLTQREARALLDKLSGSMWLIASLLYGSRLRVLESLRLRVKDIEFERRELVVRSSGKANKDRITVLPENAIIPLQGHLARVTSFSDRQRNLHQHLRGHACLANSDEMTHWL